MDQYFTDSDAHICKWVQKHGKPLGNGVWINTPVSKLQAAWIQYLLHIVTLKNVTVVHWQTYFMVGSGKSMLPSVCVTPEPLAARWLLLVLLSPSSQRRSLCPPSDLYHTVDITTGACPCALQPQSQRKAEGGQSYNWREMSVLSGNVKIWMVSLSWVRACVCGGIRAMVFVVCSFTVQRFFVSLARLWCYTVVAKQ